MCVAVACGGRPAPPAVPMAALPPIQAATLIRVGVAVDRDSVLVGATQDFSVLTGDSAAIGTGSAGAPWTARPGGVGRLILRDWQGVERDVASGVIVRPVTDGYVTIGSRRYRGEAWIIRGTAGVTVINRVTIEDYLMSVVALELGFRAPSDREAVKAQAVAARTYVARYRGRREALGFDVYATDADQVYTGIDSEFPEVADAVRATTGEILTYGGRPIQALFHSTCGWSTESIEQVWLNSAPVPYLQAVSDRSGDGPDDYYCRISPRFRWREEWTGDALASMLARTLPAAVGTPIPDLGRLTDVRVGRTSPTGRAVELVVSSTTGTWSVPSYRIREVLRTSAGSQLLSTLFQLYVERQGDGAVSKLVAAGAGYGHGVGMCQFGAVGRARAGQDYRTILATYYQGTTLERAY